MSENQRLVATAKTPEKTPQLDDQMRALNRSAFELSFLTTAPTAQKILDANFYVTELMAARNDPVQLKALESKAKILGELYLSMYAEVERYRLSSGPTANRDELLTSLLQLLATKPDKPNDATR